MKILSCHNFYKRPGGEDKVFADEAALLESRGHQVVRYCRSNDEIDTMSRFAIARQTLWNPHTTAAITRLIETERPQVMHCHNVFPLISPSVYYAARRNNVAVIQTLHNYRTLCPKTQFFRDGTVCEACINRSFAWPAVRHRCYRERRSQSAVVAAMLAYHKARHTWTSAVDRYIALTEFCKAKFVEGGLPEHKISVKPNFVGAETGTGNGSGNYAIYVGRLSPEKGIEVLLDAWKSLPVDLELRILGDGPLLETVRAAAATDHRIKPYGHRPQEEVRALLGDAKFLIMPSIWYETFGLGLIDAYAAGTPVITSRLGAMAEIVREGETGFCFEPGQASNLANTIAEAIGDPARLQKMRNSALTEYRAKYTQDKNYPILIRIYNEAIEESQL